MLDKAQLSLDDKAKIKALLDLHNAIQFMSLEESEDNEGRASDPAPGTSGHYAQRGQS